MLLAATPTTSTGFLPTSSIIGASHFLAPRTFSSTSCLSAATLPNIPGVAATTVKTSAGYAASALTALHGGAVDVAPTAALNLSREGYSLGVLGTYATVTALVMNATLRLYTSTKFAKSERKIDSIAHYLFSLVSALCVVSGAFTAVLFQLLNIYSKTALGLMNDSGYRAFTVATAAYRRWGFRCFLTSLSSFVMSFAISMFNKIDKDDRVEQIMFAVALLLIGFGAFHIKNVLNLASQFVFTPEIMSTSPHFPHA